MAPKAEGQPKEKPRFRTCLLVPPPVPPRKGGKGCKKKNTLTAPGTVGARLLRNVRAGQEGFDLNNTKAFVQALASIDGQKSPVYSLGVRKLQLAKNILAARTLQLFQAYPPEPPSNDQKIPMFTTTQLASLLMLSQSEEFFTQLNICLNEQTTESLKWEMYIHYLLSSLRICPWAASDYLFVGAVPNEVYCKALNPYKQGTYLTWCSFMSASADPQKALKELGPNSGAGKGRLLFVIKTNEYCRAKLIPKIENSYGSLESEIIITPPSTFEVETVSCVDILTTVYLTARPPGFGFDGIWAPTDPACETEELTREKGGTVEVLPEGVKITDAFIKAVVEDFAKTLQTVSAAGEKALSTTNAANVEQKGQGGYDQNALRQNQTMKDDPPVLSREAVVRMAEYDHQVMGARAREEWYSDDSDSGSDPLTFTQEEYEESMRLAEAAGGAYPDPLVLPVDSKEIIAESLANGSV